MQCPKCRLYNPGSALQCDCGYEFATGQVRAPAVALPVPSLPRLRWFLLYLALCLAQAILLGVTTEIADDPLETLLPRTLGAALLPFALGWLFSRLARPERRFQAACALAAGLWLLSLLASLAPALPRGRGGL